MITLRLRVAVLLACILLISCGIEEYYYLPQLPDGNISRTSNTGAEITIPPIPAELYYFTYYTIFYRIYPSELDTLAYITQSLMPTISSSLVGDFNALAFAIDPTNTTSVPSMSTFTNRNFFEIELDEVNIRNKLSTGGGTLSVFFPTAEGDIPFVIINGEQFSLFRSSKLLSPVPDRYFRNTLDLRNSANANSNSNADVAVHSGSPQYTYVSMYITAVGTNPTNFTQIIGKPTHISVFRLTDFN